MPSVGATSSTLTAAAAADADADANTDAEFDGDGDLSGDDEFGENHVRDSDDEFGGGDEYGDDHDGGGDDEFSGDDEFGGDDQLDAYGGDEFVGGNKFGNDDDFDDVRADTDSPCSGWLVMVPLTTDDVALGASSLRVPYCCWSAPSPRRLPPASLSLRDLGSGSACQTNLALAQSLTSAACDAALRRCRAARRCRAEPDKTDDAMAKALNATNLSDATP